VKANGITTQILPACFSPPRFNIDTKDDGPWNMYLWLQPWIGYRFVKLWRCNQWAVRLDSKDHPPTKTKPTVDGKNPAPVDMENI